jgi:co-chaperonin GroES (HSP10)
MLLGPSVKKNVATILYESDELDREGIKKGDKVYFATNADYEMELEGETVYRMRIDDILYVEKS